MAPDIIMLEISNLTVHHVRADRLVVSGGECVALSGSSGSGKTLLLRALCDMEPNTGDVFLNGDRREDVPANLWRSRVSMVPAESGWWSDIAGDHFPDSVGEALPPLLESLLLPGECLGWPVSRLSTGERHRLALARTLCLEREVLVLDEPTAPLDDQATAAVEGLIGLRKSAGAAVIIVSHDEAQVARLADRSYVMADGRLSGGAPT